MGSSSACLPRSMTKSPVGKLGAKRLHRELASFQFGDCHATNWLRPVLGRR